MSKENNNKRMSYITENVQNICEWNKRLGDGYDNRFNHLFVNERPRSAETHGSYGYHSFQDVNTIQRNSSTGIHFLESSKFGWGPC